MRKVIKILGMIVSATILLLILLPVFASMMLSLPYIQNKIIQRATIFASEYLATEVSIGSIDVTMLGRVEIDNFLVRDMDSDTLLYVPHLNSRLVGYLPVTRELNLGRSNLHGAVLNLRQTERGEMNIREIVAKLSSKEKKGERLIINIKSVEAEELSVAITQLNHPAPNYGVNVRDIQLSKISTSIEGLTIDGPTIHAKINSVSAIEKSGFELRNLKSDFYLTLGALSFTNMELKSSRSSLTLPYLILTGESWGVYKNFNTEIDLKLKVTKGYLASSDVAYFAPSMRDYGIVLRDLDLDLDGQVANMSLNVNNISFGKRSHVSLDAELRNLPDIRNLLSSVTLYDMMVTSEDVESLYGAVSGGNSLSPAVQRIVRNIGDVTVNGYLKADHGFDSLDWDFSLKSALGDIESLMRCDTSVAGQVIVEGDVKAENLNVGLLTQNSKLRDLTMRSHISGDIGRAKRFTLMNNIERVWLDGFVFRNSMISADVDGRSLNGNFTVEDNKLNFDLAYWISEGDIWGMPSDSEANEEHLQNIPYYNFALNLKKANLKALRINKRDSSSMLSASVRAMAVGRDIENLSTEIDISRAEYRYNSEVVSTSNATLVIESNDALRHIKLDSEFIDLSFNSRSRVVDIVRYLKGALSQYLPALYSVERGDDVEVAAPRKTSSSTAEISKLEITTKSLRPITSAIASGLEVADGSHIKLEFDDRNQTFTLDINSDFVERNALLAIGVNTSITSRRDSLELLSRVGELYVGTNRMIGVEMSADVLNNQIALRGHFLNPQDSASATVSTRMGLSRSQDGDLELKAQLLPSTFKRGGGTWDLKSRKIDITKGRVEIDNFTMSSRDQLLAINGNASTNVADTLSMKMTNFDLSILSAFISQVGYKVDGRTNGRVVISSALNEAKIEAKIDLDSVQINTIMAPPMSMDIRWNSRLNQASLTVENRRSRDTLVRGYYIPSKVKYYARCKVDSLNMSLLDPPLGGVITNSEGIASLDLVLQGERRKAKLAGELLISNFETSVDFTGVRYRLPEARIAVTNNKLATTGATIYDTEGNTGNLNLSVDLTHLSNIGYSIRVLPDKLMVLNTEEGDNDSFYGTLFASGMANISGDKGGVKMNITARSEGNSHFYMPLTSKSDVSSADFISFTKPIVADTLDTIVQRRRRAFETRTQSSGAMEINMSLDVQPNTEMQLVIDPTVGDIIKARGEGKLNLSLEPKANRFEIYGDYTISEGSYLFTLQNIVNKRFVINSGSSLQWSGSPTDATLNIDAVYKLKASLQPLIADESSRAVPIDCIINLSDKLTQPAVSFGIELPSADAETQAMVSNLLNDQEAISRQFFYLMLANSFIAETQGGGDLGASAGAATGFELLTNQLSNWLSTSNYNVIIRYRPESELTSEELDFGFSRGLINNRLLVELEGNYVNDNKELSEDASNFMGEAYITWLIDRAGALRLKGFTQTIDRFDENQGLQETGIGIYYRESFDNFADLRQRIKTRFSASEERLEKRAAKQKRRAENRVRRQEMIDERRNKKNKK